MSLLISLPSCQVTFPFSLSEVRFEIALGSCYMNSIAQMTMQKN